MSSIQCSDTESPTTLIIIEIKLFAKYYLLQKLFVWAKPLLLFLLSQHIHVNVWTTEIMPYFMLLIVLPTDIMKI